MATAPITAHFGAVAAEYAAFRPDYPPALFAHLAALVPGVTHAWDCATGSGQAALGLAAHVPHVHASDASAAQLAHATPHPRVAYHVARAEASALADSAVGLVTVAQALHWLDTDAFFAEARRVLAPGGAIAVWTYGLCFTADLAVDDAFLHFAEEIVGPCWPPERRLVEEGYRSVHFPFREVRSPRWVIERDWTLGQFANYLRTWSATGAYVRAHGVDPVLALEQTLRPLWGAPAQRLTVRWPLAVRIGFRE